MEITSSPFGSINDLTGHALARRLGISKSVAYAVKSGKDGISVPVAKKTARVSGDKAATLYLASQVSAMKKKAHAGELTFQGVLGNAAAITKSLGDFREDEIDTDDEEFVLALEALKTMASSAYDKIGDVETAKKSAEDEDHDVGTERDHFGRAMNASTPTATKGVRDEDEDTLGGGTTRDSFGRAM